MANYPQTVVQPDLLAMSINDLSCILDLYEGLADTAQAFANEGRSNETTACGMLADRLWVDLLRVYDAALVELRGRTPSDPKEGAVRIRVLLRHLSSSEIFASLGMLALEGATTCQDEVNPRLRTA